LAAQNFFSTKICNKYSQHMSKDALLSYLCDNVLYADVVSAV